MGTAENKALVSNYFARLVAGDAHLSELLADDVVWWVPQGSKLGGTRRGKAAVLELMGRAFSLFAPGETPRIEIGRMIAEDDCVCVQLQVKALTAKGGDYHNYYNLVFEVRDGQIAHVDEYIDTAYANERLIG